MKPIFGGEILEPDQYDSVDDENPLIMESQTLIPNELKYKGD